MRRKKRKRPWVEGENERKHETCETERFIIDLRRGVEISQEEKGIIEDTTWVSRLRFIIFNLQEI